MEIRIGGYIGNNGGISIIWIRRWKTMGQIVTIGWCWCCGWCWCLRWRYTLLKKDTHLHSNSRTTLFDLFFLFSSLPLSSAICSLFLSQIPQNKWWTFNCTVIYKVTKQQTKLHSIVSFCLGQLHLHVEPVDVWCCFDSFWVSAN